MRRTAVSLALLLLTAGGALACEPPGLSGATRVESAKHVVSFRLAPAPLPLNAPFAVEFTVCAKDGGSGPAPKLDAWMPAHRHGMNYRPKLSVIAPGQYRADGLLFHMPGRWELLFELAGDRIAAPQDLK